MINKFKLETAKRTETKEAITRTLQIANNYAGELSIEVLALDKIELDPENNRELSLTLQDAINGITISDPNYEKKRHDWKSLESLAKTIQEDQLINPIYVYRYGNKCRLIAGERRTLASAIAGKKEIIARIAPQRPIGTKLKVLQWIENNERVDLTLAERIASLDAIIKEYFTENIHQKAKVTAKLLGDLTGMSLTQSRRYLLILQAKPEIRRAITNGQLENIKLIELICSVQDSEHQEELLNAAISGLSFETINKLKNELEFHSRRSNESRSRKKIHINLGRAKPHIVKMLFSALSSSQTISEKLASHIQDMDKNIQWHNHDSIEKSFKKIILMLDQGA
jgi:ParB family chromosome partitioning protein